MRYCTLNQARSSVQVRSQRHPDSAASAAYRVEFFAGSAPDPSGHGEGRRYLGFLNVATTASGTALFGATLAAALH